MSFPFNIVDDCINTQETLKFIREPQNQYDRNAIQVLNIRNIQIGHIPRAIAAKLAPYLDEGSIIVDAVLTDRRGEFDIPMEVGLFGPSNPTRRAALKERLKASRLPYNLITQSEKEEKERAKMERQRVTKSPAAPGPSSGVLPPQFAGASSQGLTESDLSFNDLIAGSQRIDPREIGEFAEKFGTTEEDLAKMPLAEKPDRIVTEMLPYQLQGLAWLQDKENPQLPRRGSGDVVQLWKRSPNDDQLFSNIATKYASREEPKLARGGILADDMGLGKTLQMISLIVADMGNAKASRSKQPSLIIAPLGVMSNWRDQVR